MGKLRLRDTKPQWLGSLDFFPQCHSLWDADREIRRAGLDEDTLPPVLVAWEEGSWSKEVAEGPTLNSNKSGRSPWGQMCCFMPVILALRQEDKKHKVSLRDPVAISFFRKGRRKGKGENLLGEGSRSGEGLGFYMGHPPWPWKCVALRPRPLLSITAGWTGAGPGCVHPASQTLQNQFHCHPLQPLPTARCQCHIGNTKQMDCSGGMSHTKQMVGHRAQHFPVPNQLKTPSGPSVPNAGGFL